MTYQIYPNEDRGYLLKDSAPTSPSLAMFAVDSYEAGVALCKALDRPRAYEAIRSVSRRHEFKPETYILEQMLPVLQFHLGGNIRIVRAVGVVDGLENLWMHLEH